ncbi:MAG: right-handed parallel beta-helix repeat-containing protein [Acidobacteriota bacterium]
MKRWGSAGIVVLCAMIAMASGAALAQGQPKPGDGEGTCQDIDTDGVCDAEDPCVDQDGDGLGKLTYAISGCANTQTPDSNDLDPLACADTDGDGCDDCSSSSYDPLNDGADTDADGSCDAGDPDDDDDGFLDAVDCAPLDAATNPCADEVCDGFDNDCDGLIDEGFDLDSDGYAICGADCDDTDPGVHPGVSEIPCDGIDNDCDAVTGDCPGNPETVFYVSPDGRDTSDGSEQRPFRTIQRARQEVRLAIQGGMTADVRVRIAPGLYYLGGTLRFGPDDSGRNGHTVIYSGVSGQPRPLLIGARGPIVDWDAETIERADGSTVVAYAASPPARPKANSPWPERVFRTLYALDHGLVQRLVLARNPDQGYFSAAGDGICRVDESSPVTDSLPRDLQDDSIPSDLSSARVQFLVWAPTMCRDVQSSPPGILDIAAMDAGTIYFDGDRLIRSGAPYFLQGSKDFLDQPGEWFLETASGSLAKLFVVPEAPDHFWEAIIAPSVDRIIEIRGSDESKKVRNLRLESLEILVSDWVDEVPRRVWQYYDPDKEKAGIFIEHAANVEIVDCKIHNTGSDAIRVQRYGQGIRVHGSLIEKAGVMGITFWDGDGTHDLADNVISHNIVRSCGEVFPWGGGIIVNHCRQTLVSNNDIYDMPRFGIYLRSRQSVGNTVRYNEIWDVLRGSGDAGGITLWRTGSDLAENPGNLVHNNLIHDLSSNAVARFQGIGSRGIYIDKLTHGTTVSENVIYGINTEPGVRSDNFVLKGVDNILENNISVSGGSDGVDAHVLTRADTKDGDGRSNRIVRNIFYYEDGRFESLYEHKGPAAFFPECDEPCPSGGCPAWEPSTAAFCTLPSECGPPRLTEVGGNLIWHIDGTGQADPDPDIRVLSCDPVGLSVWRSELGYDADSRISDPLFCDPAGRGYKLRPESPALTELGFVPIDVAAVGAKDNLFK